MIPIAQNLENIFQPGALRPDEYLEQESGLICCSKCRTPRQNWFVLNGKRYEPRCMCACQKAAYPELTNVTITNTKKCWFKDDLANGSYSQGVELALKQRNEASLQIQKSLMSNQYIYSNAQTVASSIIINLVKQLNPDIPDLTVEVEFMD